MSAHFKHDPGPGRLHTNYPRNPYNVPRWVGWCGFLVAGLVAADGWGWFGFVLAVLSCIVVFAPSERFSGRPDHRPE